MPKKNKTELCLEYISKHNTKDYVNNYDIMQAMKIVGCKGGIIFNKILNALGDKVKNPTKELKEKLSDILIYNKYSYEEYKQFPDSMILNEFWNQHQQYKIYKEGEQGARYNKVVGGYERHMLFLDNAENSRQVLAKVLIERGVELGKFAEFIIKIANG